MEPKFARAHVSADGSVDLPLEFRRALGIEHGGMVVIELDGNDIRIRSIGEVVARAQELSRRIFADKPNVSVDDFLAYRKQDWGNA